MLIVGVTGSIGSGCSTLVDVLTDNGYEDLSLSYFVHSEWERTHPGKSSNDAPRTELQDIGNDLRSKNGNDYLAAKVVEKIEAASNKKAMYVIDSIRHPAEIALFRNNYPNFYLITVYAPGLHPYAWTEQVSMG